MAESQSKNLNHELISLFDLKKNKVKEERELSQLAFEAQRDIRYLTLMFCDGIPDLEMKINEIESIRWDSSSKKLLYVREEKVHILEGASREVRVRMRPYLVDLVKQAQKFYSCN